MREYETLYVLHPEVPEARQEEVKARVRSLIEEHGGELLHSEAWGLRELAYPIQKQKKGFYLLVRYRATPLVTGELERNLKIWDEVIRFITVRIPEHVLKRQQRAHAPEWGREKDALPIEESVNP